MANYLIEFRVRGYAKKYARQLMYEIGHKFKVRGVTKGSAVPHTTLYGPFTTNNESRVVSSVQNLCSKYNRIYFSFRGFNYFNNHQKKVIYLNIVPSNDYRQFRYDLASVLRPITSSNSIEDRKSKEDFVFHSTIAFKDIDRKFNDIWSYIKNKERPNIRQTLIRVTVLKNGKILYEYDFLQKKLLNRRQALSREEYNKTIEILKQQSRPEDIDEEDIKTNQTLWEKLKRFFKHE